MREDLPSRCLSAVEVYRLGLQSGKTPRSGRHQQGGIEAEPATCEGGPLLSAKAADAETRPRRDFAVRNPSNGS